LAATATIHTEQQAGNRDKDHNAQPLPTHGLLLDLFKPGHAHPRGFANLVKGEAKSNSDEGRRVTP
jgi:hypothetical protein